MSKKDLHCKFSASKGALEVFTKICRVAQWWTVDVQGNAGILNGKFTVYFGESHVTMDVIEMKPYCRIVWLVRNAHWSFPGDCAKWEGSAIIWDIAAAENTTRLTMTHRGLRYGTACYDIFSEGWGLYMGNSLLRYINKGAGMPFRGPDSNDVILK